MNLKQEWKIFHFVYKTILKKKKESAFFLPWNNGMGIKWEKSATILGSIKSSAMLKKKD